MRLFAGEAPGSLRCELDLDPSAWSHRGGGLWSASLPTPALSQTADGGAAESTLQGEDGSISMVVDYRVRKRLAESGDGEVGAVVFQLVRSSRPCFTLVGGRIHLFLEKAGISPPPMALEYTLSLGRPAGESWRVVYEDLVADGIPVLSGGSETIVTQIPEESVLRFRTVAVSGAEEGGEVHFRVRLDDEILFDTTQHASLNAVCSEHVLSLPREGRARAALRFEVTGSFALSSFLQPVIGPAFVGEYGERPWSKVHPDIVLLIGDTFRADNLSAWGGDPEIAPILNRFAARSRRYMAARAPATSTLPSHAALFTSLYPPQSGVRSGEDRLGPEAHTLAEHLSDVGYRTVAVTDAGFVSWRHGLDQGFESFEQDRDPEFDFTLEAVRRQLAQDDGRPLFLFVHSYRAHDPYAVSESARARLGDRYSLDPVEWEDLLRDVFRDVNQSGRGAPTAPGIESVERLRSLYRGGSSDTGEGFGRVLGLLEDIGLAQHAILVFTSDHGEALGENGVVGHGTAVWDTEALVPLLVAAPGLDPIAVADSVSLIDLPPTLAALAGIERHPGWTGRDCSKAVSPAPVFTFTGRPATHAREVAIVFGGRKLILEAEDGPGELRHAYILDEDSAEQHDQAASGWAVDLSSELRDPLQWLFRSPREREKAQLSPALRSQLEALGYLGD